MPRLWITTPLFMRPRAHLGGKEWRPSPKSAVYIIAGIARGVGRQGCMAKRRRHAGHQSVYAGGEKKRLLNSHLSRS